MTNDNQRPSSKLEAERCDKCGWHAGSADYCGESLCDHQLPSKQQNAPASAPAEVRVEGTAAAANAGGLTDEKAAEIMVQMREHMVAWGEAQDEAKPEGHVRLDIEDDGEVGFPEFAGECMRYLAPRLAEACRAPAADAGVLYPQTADPFADRDQSKTAEQQGAFRKFEVRRVDGKDALGEKHHNCVYFVLDLSHDPFAIPAMHAYAAACEKTHPALAHDIWIAHGKPADSPAAVGAAGHEGGAA